MNEKIHEAISTDFNKINEQYYFLLKIINIYTNKQAKNIWVKRETPLQHLSNTQHFYSHYSQHKSVY